LVINLKTTKALGLTIPLLMQPQKACTLCFGQGDISQNTYLEDFSRALRIGGERRSEKSYPHRTNKRAPALTESPHEPQ
jgi:hypothetical protein